MKSRAETATAAQLAAALQVTKPTVTRRAALEGWAFDEHPGRGGMRRLYRVATLPADVRLALYRQTASASFSAEHEGRLTGARQALRAALHQRADDVRQQASLQQAAALTPAAQARLDARLAVLSACEAYARGSGLPLHQARIAFALAYNDGSLLVPDSVRAQVPRTSDASIERWQTLLKNRGVSALGGSYGNRAGSGSIDMQPALQTFIHAMLTEFPHARPSQVMQGLQARFGAAGAPVRADLPSMRSLERWIGQWRADHAGTLLALANPDAWKNRHMVAFGSRSDGIDRLNQLWELDSSPADLMTDDGRVSLIGGIDVGTRWPRLVVSKTSKAVSVAALIRRMLLEMGVPERVKTDNGADYTGHHITRVFAALSPDGADIQELCPPFQPWHKPHIERFFGTFTRDLVELCPGFIGHDVTERSAIEARTSFADRLMKRGELVRVHMSAKDLQAFCDKWIDSVYMHNPHDGLGGITPFEAVASAGGDRRRIDDEHALDILLAEAPGNNGRRVVGKKGIRLDETHFIAPELEAWVGREVQVRFDAVQHDLGRLYVFGGDNMAFICIAEAPERTGMNRHEVAIKAKAMQTKRVQDERRALKAAAKKVGTDQVVGEILRHRAASAGKLAMLPTRAASAHSSAGLIAAADAAAATASARAPKRTTADLEHLQAVRAAQARLSAGAPAVSNGEQVAQRAASPTAAPPVFESLAARVMWLLRQEAGRTLSIDEADCMSTFRQAQPASYRRMVELIAPKEPAQPRPAGGAEPA